MTDARNHADYSELLPGFLDGTLAPDDTHELEAHVESCDECRAELRGLEALRATTGGELTVSERGTLERAVMSGIAQEGNRADVVPLAPRRGIGFRVAGALGAAATVAVIASLVYFGASDGFDRSTMGDTGVTAEQDGAGRSVKDRARRSEERVAAGKAEDSDVLNAESEGTAAGGDQASSPVPTFRIEKRPLTGADLQKRGESSLESVRSAAYFSADDAAGNRTLLEQLVDSARSVAGDDVADQVDRCASQVLETSDPTVPTFGSLGELDGRDVLVLGFAWTRARSGPLDRYMVWAWERGSCDVAVDFVEGKIETAN